MSKDLSDNAPVLQSSFSPTFLTSSLRSLQDLSFSGITVLAFLAVYKIGGRLCTLSGVSRCIDSTRPGRLSRTEDSEL